MYFSLSDEFEVNSSSEKLTFKATMPGLVSVLHYDFKVPRTL